MERARDVAKMANSRPKSMSDFAALLDASTPLHHHSERMRKKPSISLAAGLIMNHESQNGTPRSLPDTPHLLNGRMGGSGTEGQESLFFAYAQKADYAQSPPYVLTFASAAVADQWWSLVQQEYPSSSREGPQLFILKGDDMQEQIQDNPRFYSLRNKWFYTPSDGGTPIIPLQDLRGNPVTDGTRPPSRPGSQSVFHDAIQEEKEPAPEPFDMKALSATLTQMNAMISENSAQIRALSVAQSEGLQRMQEINESNSTQIKALADGQAKLQTLMGENASHYVALSNSSFANQEQVKGVLQTNAEQIKALADGQMKLATTCAGMMKTIENLGQTVSKVSENVSNLHLGGSHSDVGSLPFSQIGNKIAPPPRKLNRRIKGVWYEYDTTSTSTGPSLLSSPRRSVAMAPETPPKSPASTRNWNS